MEYTIGSICAMVDTDKTHQRYCKLKNNGKRDGSSYNFVKNIQLREKPINEYFQALGINPYLFQDLHEESINASQQTLMYCGYYPLEIINEEEVLELINDRDEQDEFLETISTEIGFELSFENWNGQVALYFEVNMPWLLTPAIEKGKYDNKTVLPKVDVDSLTL